MKIMILGWYGTETIGDRAILAGIVYFFCRTYESFSIELGSLYPFFSERTIKEDSDFIKKITERDIDFAIFDSKNSREVLSAIKKSDLLIVGGGPLMDLDELYMLEYAFKKAKKIGIPTAILGCGVGPLFYKKYKKSVMHIILNSDFVILRDKSSKRNLEKIYTEFGVKFETEKIHTSFDPAVAAALAYVRLGGCDAEEELDSYIGVNLRRFPSNYSRKNISKDIDIGLENFIKELSKKYPDKEIKLIPMHYFHIGDDDRLFLNKIALNIGEGNIKVQNPNLNLEQTIKTYRNSYFNIGMRFHAVVLQTISSGKNYILDYTEPKKGKINGFLEDIDESNFFSNRYISLQEDVLNINIIKNERSRFNFDESYVLRRLDVYEEQLKMLLK